MIESTTANKYDKKIFSLVTSRRVTGHNKKNDEYCNIDSPLPAAIKTTIEYPNSPVDVTLHPWRYYLVYII